MIDHLTCGELNNVYLKYGSIASYIKHLREVEEAEQKEVKEVERIRKVKRLFYFNALPYEYTRPIVKRPKKRFREKVNASLKMPIRKGYHRDHIVPISFCRKLGLTISQINHPENLQYLTEKENLAKWSYVNIDDVKRLCRVWNIPPPDKKIIDDHNNKVKVPNFVLDIEP